MGRKSRNKKRKRLSPPPASPGGGAQAVSGKPSRPPGPGRTKPAPTNARRRSDTAASASDLRKSSLLILAVALAAYIQTVAADFTFDDIPIVRDNLRIQALSNIPEFFETNYWGPQETYGDKSLYRPLILTTYALNYAAHSGSPAGYHLVNIALHAMASLLLLRLLYAVFENSHLALIAACWFAVHPIHTEAVSGIVGRAELLAFLGIFACAWCYLRGLSPDVQNPLSRLGWLAGSVLAFAMGVFSKETGAVAPAVILLTELLMPKHRRLFRLDKRALTVFLGYAAIFGLYLHMRSAAVQGAIRSIDFADLSVAERVFTGLRVCAEYVGLLLAPIKLVADYPPGDLRISSSLADPGVLLAILLLLAGLTVIAWSWRKAPAIAWGLLLFMGTLFPLSNIPFPIGIMKAERILYTPSAGFLVAVSALLIFWLGPPRSRPTLWLITWVVAGVLAMRTIARNLDWRTNYHLAKATLEASPASNKFRNVMFNWYRDQGQDDLARAYMGESGAINTLSGVFNMGNLEMDQGNYDAAIAMYRRALKADPGHTRAMNNLGRALEAKGDLAGAIEVFHQFMERAPGNPGAYVNLMHLYLKIRNAEAALPIAEEGMRRFPETDAVLWNAGAVFQALGRTQQAEEAFARAKALNTAITKQQDIDVTF